MQISNPLTTLPRDLFSALLNTYLGRTERARLRSSCVSLRRNVDDVATSLTIKLQDIAADGTDWCYLKSLIEHMGCLTHVYLTSETIITTSALQAFILAAGQSLRNSLLDLRLEPGTANHISPILTMPVFEVTTTPLKLSPLAACPHLTRLEVGYYDALVDLTGLGGLSDLQHLTLGGDSYDSMPIRDLSPLSNCTALRHLSLWDCNELLELSPLAACIGLRHLSLFGCTKLSTISALAPCTELEYVGLKYCYGLTNISPSGFMASTHPLTYILFMGV
jgi:hypothetical protein